MASLYMDELPTRPLLLILKEKEKVCPENHHLSLKGAETVLT